MKKVFLLLLITLPYILFSQGETNKETINWISLKKAEKYSKRYNSKILIYFYKPKCEFCDRMNKETLNNPEIISLINNNFLAVKINGYTKDTIIYNNKSYGNQQPASSGRHDWRHDFYYELANYNNRIITPTIVIMNSNHQEISQLTGFKPKAQLLRELRKIIN